MTSTSQILPLPTAGVVASMQQPSVGLMAFPPSRVPFSMPMSVQPHRLPSVMPPLSSVTGMPCEYVDMIRCSHTCTHTL